MDGLLFKILNYISLTVGLSGVAFIILGVIKIFARSVFIELSKHTEIKTTKDRENLRRQLSSYLLLGLELMIAGDIIGTIIHPTLQEMAVLGSIVAVRTVISFFLNRESEKT